MLYLCKIKKYSFSQYISYENTLVNNIIINYLSIMLITKSLKTIISMIMSYSKKKNVHILSVAKNNQYIHILKDLSINDLYYLYDSRLVQNFWLFQNVFMSLKYMI